MGGILSLINKIIQRGFFFFCPFHIDIPQGGKSTGSSVSTSLTSKTVENELLYFFKLPSLCGFEMDQNKVAHRQAEEQSPKQWNTGASGR